MTPFYLIGAGISTIILVILTLICQIRKISKNLHKPPGKTGWPLIGESVTFILNPRKFILDRMIKYSSEIFITSLAGEKVAVFCGPMANKYIFSNESKLAFYWVPASVAAVISIPDINTSNKIVKPSKQLWFQYLKVDSIKRHISTVDLIAKDHMTTHWDSKNVVKVYDLAKEYMLVSCLRVFLNYSCSSKDELKKLGDPLHLAIKGFISIPINVPGTAYNKAIVSSNLFRKKIVEIIRKRKITMSSQGKVDNDFGEDFLSKFMANCVRKDDELSDEDLAREVIGFIVAGSYSTSTAITFTLAFLAEYPQVYEMVLKEQQEIVDSKQPGDPLTWMDLQKMQYLWNVVCETMRLQPPTVGNLLSVIADFTYAGFQIPKGWKVLWTPYSTHTDPKYFDNPEKFDPSRFEKSTPTPYTFVPFGGGSHLCPGRDLARVLILVYVHHIVTRYKFVRVNPNEKIIFNPDPIPTEGLPIYLQPHVKSMYIIKGGFFFRASS